MSWYGLLSILKGKYLIRDTEQSQPPRACPHDGEPLQGTPDGGLHCPFDGYTWPDGDNQAIR